MELVCSSVALKLLDGFLQISVHMKRIDVPRDICYMTSHLIRLGGYVQVAK